MTSDSEKFVAAHSDQVGRIDKMVLNLFASNQMKFAFERLKLLPKENSMETLLQADCLILAIAVCYGRIFSETDGTTKLSKKQVPNELKHLHDEIISLRNARYAHHGNHDTVRPTLDL